MLHFEETVVLVERINVNCDSLSMWAMHVFKPVREHLRAA